MVMKNLEVSNKSLHGMFDGHKRFQISKVRKIRTAYAKVIDRSTNPKLSGNPLNVRKRFQRLDRVTKNLRGFK